jgi:hypothetical protein
MVWIMSIARQANGLIYTCSPSGRQLFIILLAFLQQVRQLKPGTLCHLDVGLGKSPMLQYLQEIASSAGTPFLLQDLSADGDDADLEADIAAAIQGRATATASAAVMSRSSPTEENACTCAAGEIDATCQLEATVLAKTACIAASSPPPTDVARCAANIASVAAARQQTQPPAAAPPSDPALDRALVDLNAAQKEFFLLLLQLDRAHQDTAYA